MSWLEHHRVSEQLTIEGERHTREGNTMAAAKAYTLAAEAEERALADLHPSKKRTRGVSLASIAARRYRAGELELAKKLAHRALREADVTPYASRRLHELLQLIANDAGRTRTG